MMNAGMMNKLRKMQKELIETQKKLEATEFVGTAGGGMVKVTVLGNKIRVRHLLLSSSKSVRLLSALKVWLT